MVLLFVIKGNAQNVTYTTSTDDPDDVKNFQVHLSPFYMDMSRANLINMGWELWATADIKKKLRFMTSFRSSYLELNKPPAVSEVPPINTYYTKAHIGKSWKFEAIGQFNFVDRTRKGSVKVILEQYTTGYGKYSTTHTKYLMVPGTIRKSYGLRGGIYNLYTAIKLENTKGLNGGSAFYILDKKHAQSALSDTIKMSGYNSMNSMVFAAGIDMRKVVNLIINTDTYGTCASRSSTNLYVDLLLAVFNNYRNVFYIDSGKTTEYTVKPFGKRPLGWRVGWQFTNPEKAGMSMKFEFGKRPEWQSKGASGIFMDFNVGINIPFRVKKLE